MAESIKEKVADAAHAIADTAKTVSQKFSNGAVKAGEFVKEKTGLGDSTECSTECTDVGVAGIKEQMMVIASCGKRIGMVDRIEGDTIKLTKADSPDGHHHFIPTSWVKRVDNYVHLTKDSQEAEKGWKSDLDVASCGCG